MRSVTLVACVCWVCVSLSEPFLAQTIGYVVAEYLAPQFTAPADAPSDIVVADKDEPGMRMVVTGRTLVGEKPVTGVSIYVFHTDINGKYSSDNDNKVGELHPRLHGALRTDAQGRYRFETIRPGSYDNAPSQVRYVVKADGYEPLLIALQFEDDPIVVSMQKTGAPFVNADSFKNGPCKSRADCVLTQPVAIDAQGVAHVTRDIQMIPLNSQAGSEPAPGVPDSKVIFETKCSTCHGLEDIYATKRSASEWSTLITQMRDYGAEVNDQEHKLILDYLSKNVGR